MKTHLLISLLALANSQNTISSEKLPYNPERTDKLSGKIVDPTILVMHYDCKDELDLNALTKVGVSVHYTIDKDGTVYATATGNDEEKIAIDPSNPDTEYLKRSAFHAGHSYWKDATDQPRLNINPNSIGIMFVNKGATPVNRPNVYTDREVSEPTTWYDYTPEQINAAGILCQSLQRIFNIDSKDIIGHGEAAIDPTTRSLGRKVGPGPRFPWKQLSDEYKVGVFHTLTAEELDRPCSIEPIELQQLLSQHGYSIPVDNQDDSATHQAVLQAQIHHNPTRINGDCRDCALYWIFKNLQAQREHKAHQTLEPIIGRHSSDF